MALHACGCCCWSEATVPELAAALSGQPVMIVTASTLLVMAVTVLSELLSSPSLEVLQ